MQFISEIDLIMGPLTLLFIYAGLYQWKKRSYKNSVIGKYIIPGFTVRVLGTLAFAFVYQFYYNGGDTAYYFRGGNIIGQALIEKPATGLELIMVNHVDYSSEALNYATRHRWFFSNTEAFVMKTAGIFDVPALSSYFSIAFIFALLSFIGGWLVFLTFYKIYPHLHKQIAIATLFIPSVFFWGSGLLKEPLCMFAIGLVTYSVYLIAIKRRFHLGHLMMLGFGVFTLNSVKPYILYALLPAILVWVVFHYRTTIQNKTLRVLSGPLLIPFAIAIGVTLIVSVGSDSRYSIENIQRTLEATQQWHGQVSEQQGGSGYSISGSGIQAFPIAIVTTFFRPFPWEADKAINLAAMIESMLFLILTLYIIYHVGLINFIKSIYSNPHILFVFVFSILFAYGVGLSSYNFGALVRYKIPCLPFYFLSLIMLYDTYARRNINVATQKVVVLGKQPQKALAG